MPNARPTRKAAQHDNVIDLERHRRTWTDARRVERFLRSKRVEAPVARATVRFADAVPPLGDTLPRTWTAPLIASLPKRPTAGDLELAVAGAARYFEYLEAQQALPREGATICQYDLLSAAHIVEELIFAGLDHERMAWEERHGAADKVRQRDALLAERPEQSIAGDVSWLGGWVQYRSTWVVLWMPAGGGTPVATSTAPANERPAALSALYMEAFMRAAKARRAPARLGVFSAAQERAMRAFALQCDLRLLPLYRLRAASPLRFHAAQLLLE